MAQLLSTPEKSQDTSSGRWTRLHVMVLLICCLLNAIDGMDIVIMAYIAPELKNDWGLGPEILGTVFSASLAGMAVGGLLIAPLADKFGRRPLIITLITVITITMFLSSQVRTVTELVVLRAIIGMCAGAFLASVTTVAADFAPRGKQAFAVAIAISGYALGAAATGLTVAHFLPVWGWRGTLMVAGTVSLVILPLVVFLLPESIDYLKRVQPKGALSRLNHIMARLGEPPLDTLPPKSVKIKNSVVTVFEDGRLAGTLSLWLAIIMGFMTFYFLVSWITQLSVQSGLPVDKAIYVGALFNLGGFTGTLMLGVLTLRIGLRTITFTAMMLGALVVGMFGYVSSSLMVMLVLAYLAGVTTNGGFNCFYALAAEIYPTQIRSTGIGWAMGVGRLGAVLGPMLGGILIGQGLSIPNLMVLYAIPLVIAAFAALFVRARQVSVPRTNPILTE